MLLRKSSIIRDFPEFLNFKNTSFRKDTSLVKNLRGGFLKNCFLQKNESRFSEKDYDFR